MPGMTYQCSWARTSVPALGVPVIDLALTSGNAFTTLLATTGFQRTLPQCQIFPALWLKVLLFMILVPYDRFSSFVMVFQHERSSRTPMWEVSIFMEPSKYKPSSGLVTVFQ